MSVRIVLMLCVYVISPPITLISLVFPVSSFSPQQLVWLSFASFSALHCSACYCFVFSFV
ncbi:hypothetical protein BDW75DRAFT_198137 [Aspergillus navahoensis]